MPIQFANSNQRIPRDLPIDIRTFAHNAKVDCLPDDWPEVAILNWPDFYCTPGFENRLEWPFVRKLLLIPFEMAARIDRSLGQVDAENEMIWSVSV